LRSLPKTDKQCIQDASHFAVLCCLDACSSQSWASTSYHWSRPCWCNMCLRSASSAPAYSEHPCDITALLDASNAHRRQSGLPLDKQRNKHFMCMQVVMAQWADPEPSDWSQYASRLRQLWHNPKWCRSIYVDDAPVPGSTHNHNLHSQLQHIAARACSLCDPQGHRPFPSNVALTKHVTAQHHQHMCTVCLNVSQSLTVSIVSCYPQMQPSFLCVSLLSISPFVLAT